MYPEIMLVPMREELTNVGVQELRTAEEVDQAITTQPGTAMVIVNSICGCAAGRMRPAVRAALQNASRPEKVYSVFAGQDTAATERARSYFTGYPPSSPSIAILRDGKLLYMMQRSDIERREAAEIAFELKKAFEQHCGTTAIASGQ
jgi:putative YphP/YqiW family bacilliredoxin